MTAFPLVQGFCPACGKPSLFLGSGGYVTCSRLDCSEPDAASTLLERRRAPCSSAALRRLPHQPHDWEPQPGMKPVHCPAVIAT